MSEGQEKVIVHGGSLIRAKLAFPHAPDPWIDLSTGINPHSYAHSVLPATAFSRLPEPADLQRLRELAAATYGAGSASCMAAAPGTHLFLPMLIDAVFTDRRGKPLKAAILSPTYAEHAATCRLCGFETLEVSDWQALAGADLAIVVNPNNPDGRFLEDDALLALSHELAAKGGLLVVDEAFRDALDAPSSLTGQVHAGLSVLRSFGKFYGLAGVRLGFAISCPPVAERLRHMLGPWAVPGPALHIALEALADHEWQAMMRNRLREEAARLDAILAGAGLELLGGTSLFRFVRHPQAAGIYRALAAQGILVRPFDHSPDCLRIGLPAAQDWARVQQAFCTENWHL